MDAVIKAHLETIQFGPVQIGKHVAVIPITGDSDSGPQYLTLKEAMDGNFITVSEITESGHVPELKVINRADRPVLLLDGEELAGAKQNRVLNTTILIKELSETIIPVSCTEHGRWSYNSARFRESGHIMTARIRSAKNASVSRSLKADCSFRSDQSAVWENIAGQAEALNVRSATGAMRDILDARQQDLDEFLPCFPLLPGQNGMIVLVNGTVAGLDRISRSGAFGILHPKLIRSYLLDALTEKPAGSATDSLQTAISFLRQARDCSESRFESVGYGQDLRYEGRQITGSALKHGDAAIHMAFFRTASGDDSEYLSPLSRRRAARQSRHAPPRGVRAPDHRKTSLQPGPIYRSYWVIPGRLLAGFYPGSKDPVQESANLQALLNAGIRHFINLMDADERDHDGNPFRPYHERLRFMAELQGLDVTWERAAIGDFSVPTQAQMVRILNRIDQAMALHRPVYVHCWGGIGRTGTVVGCYLARHGIAAGDAAIEEIRRIRRNDPTAHRISPETAEQRSFVRNWRPGE